MSDLLYDLVLDERNFVRNGNEYFRALAPPVARILSELNEQLNRLEAIMLHLDALAVPQIKSEGHEECFQFLSLATEPEEFDFSVETEKKRVASIA